MSIIIMPGVPLDHTWLTQLHVNEMTLAKGWPPERPSLWLEDLGFEPQHQRYLQGKEEDWRLHSTTWPITWSIRPRHRNTNWDSRHHRLVELPWLAILFGYFHALIWRGKYIPENERSFTFEPLLDLPLCASSLGWFQFACSCYNKTVNIECFIEFCESF